MLADFAAVAGTATEVTEATTAGAETDGASAIGVLAKTAEGADLDHKRLLSFDGELFDA